MAWSEEASHYTTRLGNRTTPARSRLGCAFARPANRRTEDFAVPISVYASDPKDPARGDAACTARIVTPHRASSASASIPWQPLQLPPPVAL